MRKPLVYTLLACLGLIGLVKAQTFQSTFIPGILPRYAYANQGGSSSVGTIAIDTVSFGITATFLPSLTVAHTVTGVNPCLMIHTGIRRSSGQFVQTVTYNGVNVPITESGDGDRSEPDTWFLANAPTGTHNIVITPNADAYLGLIAVSYTNCISTGNTTQAWDDTTGATSLSTASVTAVGDVADEVTLVYDGTGIPTMNSTQQSLARISNAEFFLEASTITAIAPTTSMGSTFSGGFRVKMIETPLRNH